MTTRESEISNYKRVECMTTRKSGVYDYKEEWSVWLRMECVATTGS